MHAATECRIDININIDILPRRINHTNRYGPVVQVRSRSPPFRIPSAIMGYGWGLRVECFCGGWLCVAGGIKMGLCAGVWVQCRCWSYGGQGVKHGLVGLQRLQLKAVIIYYLVVRSGVREACV